MGTTPNDAARRIDRLYTYRDEFASREPRLLRAGLFAFIDKTAVPRSIQYQLLSNYLCVSPETGPEKGRFQVCPITRRPVLLPPRSVESILSEAEAIWTFDDSSSRISDARGEHPATGINTMAVAGKANGAVWLNGSNAYVSTALNLKGWKSFTIAFWVKPDLTSRDDIAVILDNGSNQMENFALQSIGNSLTWFSWIYGSSAAFELPTGTWTHVTLTADLASRQIQVYLNGLKKVSIDTPAIKGPGPVPLTFGKWATADARYFRGALDEIEVWDYVLEEEDIPRLYEYQATGRRPQRQTPPPSNL
jgi:hypothetical protein